MPKRSVYTEVALDILKDFENMLAEPMTEIPFMEEVLSKEEFRTRYSKLNESGKKGLVLKLGIPTIMEQLGSE